jgi:hypothetical protein
MSCFSSSELFQLFKISLTREPARLTFVLEDAASRVSTGKPELFKIAKNNRPNGPEFPTTYDARKRN